MKKIACCALILAACGGQSATVPGDTDDSGLNVVNSPPPQNAGSGSSASSGSTAGSSGAGGGNTPGASGDNGGNPGGGTRPDGGPPGTLPLITPTMCGTETCSSTQECCVTAGARTATVACADKGKCGGDSIVASCSSAASCTGGQVCCESADPTRGDLGLTSTCEDSCTTDAGRGAIDVQLCATDAECPAGETCERADNLDVCLRIPEPIIRDAGVIDRFDASGIIDRFDAAGIVDRFDAGDAGRRGRDAAL